VKFLKVIAVITAILGYFKNVRHTVIHPHKLRNTYKTVQRFMCRTPSAQHGRKILKKHVFSFNTFSQCVFHLDTMTYETFFHKVKKTLNIGIFS